MISKETLNSVKIGILTDKELDDALTHYEALEELLLPHGEVYHLVWKDVYYELIRLRDYKKSRSNRK